VPIRSADCIVANYACNMKLVIHIGENEASCNNHFAFCTISESFTENIRMEFHRCEYSMKKRRAAEIASARKSVIILSLG